MQHTDGPLTGPHRFDGSRLLLRVDSVTQIHAMTSSADITDGDAQAVDAHTGQRPLPGGSSTLASRGPERL